MYTKMRQDWSKQCAIDSTTMSLFIFIFYFIFCNDNSEVIFKMTKFSYKINYNLKL